MTQQLAPVSTLQRRGPGAPLAVAGTTLALTVALRLHDPHQHASWGLCPFRELTGWDCPGCGGLRAVNDLTHGHVAAAMGSNLFFVASIPLLVALWGVWFWRSRQRNHLGNDPGDGARRRLLPPGRANLLASLYFGALIVFTIVRNTPWGHSLYA